MTKRSFAQIRSVVTTVSRSIRNLVAFGAWRTSIEPYRSSSIYEIAPQGSAPSRLVQPDAHQLLAEIGALQESHERSGVLSRPSVMHSRCLTLPLAQEIGVTRGEIADELRCFSHA
jgi:hypothetical protein